MEALVLALTIVGGIASLIAIYEKVPQRLLSSVSAPRRFERAYQAWANSTRLRLPKYPESSQILPAIHFADLDADRRLFALACAVKYGDPAILELIGLNRANPEAPTCLLDLVDGHGQRVQWRAAFALSQIATPERLDSLTDELTASESTSPQFTRALDQLLSTGVANHLREQLRTGDVAHREKVREVMVQLKIPREGEWNAKQHDS